MTVRRSASFASALATFATAGFVGAIAFAPAASARPVSVQFTQPGGPYAWTVPAGVSSIHVDAVGGSGAYAYSIPGGAGGEVQADLPVTPGTVLDIHVAGNANGGTGGVNGGGAGGGSYAGGGGGASDVRTGGDTLADRVLVAAGGGGGGAFGTAGAAEQPGTNGGNCFDPVAQPGSATAGGAGGGGCDGSAGTAGTIGVGGTGGNRPSGNDYGGGGGGGYYGGGGAGPYGGGAGGSDYVTADGSNVATSTATYGATPFVHITYAAPPATAVGVTASAPSLPADGVSTATVTATATDAFGSPVPGDQVDFQSTDPGVQFGPVTDQGDGTYAATVTASTTYGTATITAIDSSGANPVEGTTTLVITALPQSISVTSGPGSTAPLGTDHELVATGGDSGNPVVFSVDPTTSNAGTPTAACSVLDATVTFDHAGSCVVDADQAGNSQYAAAPTQQLTVIVDPAATDTALRVAPRALIATINAVAPAQGIPQGTVTFAVDGSPVGTAPVSGGVARLDYTVPAGMTRHVSAGFTGSADFLASSVSTARRDPHIAAQLSSASGKTRYGWYRGPVTITFTCTIHGSPLRGACPGPVALRHDAAAQSVSRTIFADNGGADTVSITGISIDTHAPKVSVRGPRSGAVYAGSAPGATCVAHDRLSGIATCQVVIDQKHETIRYRAIARDKAGNRTVARGHYRVLDYYLQGAAYRTGAFEVTAGSTYLLVAQTTTPRAPRFYSAAPAGQRPNPRGSLMRSAGVRDGLHIWTLPVRIDHGLGRYPVWNLGVRAVDGMHLIRFRPSGR